MQGPIHCGCLPVSCYHLLQSLKSRHGQKPILMGSCLILFEGFTTLPGLVSKQQTQVCPALYPPASSTVGTTGKCFFSILLPGVTGTQPSEVNNFCVLCAGNLAKGTCCKPCDLWSMTQVLGLSKAFNSVALPGALEWTAFVVSPILNSKGNFSH